MWARAWPSPARTAHDHGRAGRSRRRALAAARVWRPWRRRPALPDRVVGCRHRFAGRDAGPAAASARRRPGDDDRPGRGLRRRASQAGLAAAAGRSSDADGPEGASGSGCCTTTALPSRRRCAGCSTPSDARPRSASPGRSSCRWDDPDVLLEVGLTTSRGGRRRTEIEPASATRVSRTIAPTCWPSAPPGCSSGATSGTDSVGSTRRCRSSATTSTSAGGPSWPVSASWSCRTPRSPTPRRAVAGPGRSTPSAAHHAGWTVPTACRSP